mgnify:CR=1 FL=1|tara:strand:+ start:3689 stop:3871 length:183 start_codon:yes stop_codon:yes gene_type:complete
MSDIVRKLRKRADLLSANNIMPAIQSELLEAAELIEQFEDLCDKEMGEAIEGLLQLSGRS